MSPVDFTLLLEEGVLGATHNTEVRQSTLGQTNRHFHALEVVLVAWVSHVFQDDALLHLTDVLLLHNLHKVSESAVDEVSMESVTLTHAHVQETAATLKTQLRNSLRRH